MKIYFNEYSSVNPDTFVEIKPGDIILFSAIGRNRSLRFHDGLIMLAQAIFKKEYQPKHDRANPGITHAAICTRVGNDGKPIIVEINRAGFSEHELYKSNLHKREGLLLAYKFRPLHVFKPTENTFRNELIKAATDPEAKKARWNLRTAMGALVNRKKTQGIGYDSQEKIQHRVNTHCTAFVVRTMKIAAQNAGQQAQSENNSELVDRIRQFYPDIPSNTSPSSLLSYLLDKVEGESPLFEHNIHLDINPYAGLQKVIELQIQRLEDKKTEGANGAEMKVEKLKSAYKDAKKTIEHDCQHLNPLEKAQKLLELISETLKNKRTQFNPFKQATSFTSAEQYVANAQTYAKRLR